jgi:hypothetical protein
VFNSGNKSLNFGKINNNKKIMSNLNYNKKFNHDTSYDLFADYKLLAREAANAGLSTKEYFKLYDSNLMDAKEWNTASGFIAFVKSVETEKVEGGYQTAWVEYTVRAGSENEETNRIRIGILSSEGNRETDRLHRVACSLIDKKAKMFKGYRRSKNDDADFSVLLDIETF